MPTLHIDPIAGALGAEISNVQLSGDLEPSVVGEIKSALFEYGAICFRDQELSREKHLAFAKSLGELEVHPIVNGMEGFPEIIRMHKPAGDDATFGVGWHSDNSFFEKPSLGSIVYAEKVPPVGGDTLFASQALAFEQLSPGMQKMLEGLIAIHTAEDAYTSDSALEKYDGDGPITYRRSDAVHLTVEHPAVIRHPVTGRKALYLNPMFTVSFKDMTREESRPLLEYLFRHAIREDFQCRVRWQPGTVVMWDNRLVQHAALNDYAKYERLLYRATLNGDALN